MIKELEILKSRIERLNLSPTDRLMIQDALWSTEKAFALVQFKYNMTLQSKGALNSLLAQVSSDFSNKVQELEQKKGELERMNYDFKIAKNLAEKANEAKGVFLANMSHEIRTPLTSILGSAELLAQSVRDEENQEMALMIGKSGSRLMETLNSVLDIAKLGNKSIPFRPQKICLVQVALDTVELFSLQAEAKNLNIDTFLDSDDRFYVATDPSALNRVLYNLVSNSIRFTSEGSIDIEVRKIADYGEISVVDTGIGISASFLDELYTPFSQESTGHGRNYEGTGLGLAICKQLVDAIGGTISVQSEKNLGTKFSIRLPLFPVNELMVSDISDGTNGESSDIESHNHENELGLALSNSA